jgi:hypothetical protein
MPRILRRARPRRAVMTERPMTAGVLSDDFEEVATGALVIVIVGATDALAGPDVAGVDEVDESVMPDGTAVAL